MHKQGQAFCVCMANQLRSLSACLGTREGTEKVVVFDAQFCQVCTCGLKVQALHLAHSASSNWCRCKLTRDSLPLLAEPLDIQVVTRESESEESM